MAGTWAPALGRGGPIRVAEASGMSSSTVMTGAEEMASGAELSDRVRGAGAGRRFLID